MHNVKHDLTGLDIIIAVILYLRSLIISAIFVAVVTEYIGTCTCTVHHEIIIIITVIVLY